MPEHGRRNEVGRDIHKISIYLDEEFHRTLKAKASTLGLSLSEFIARAARDALYQPSRGVASDSMDRLRCQVPSTFTAAEIRKMRDTGRE